MPGRSLRPSVRHCRRGVRQLFAQRTHLLEWLLQQLKAGPLDGHADDHLLTSGSGAGLRMSTTMRITTQIATSGQKNAPTIVPARLPARSPAFSARDFPGVNL